jgi:hypothetical protein
MRFQHVISDSDAREYKTKIVPGGRQNTNNKTGNSPVLYSVFCRPPGTTSGCTDVTIDGRTIARVCK